MNDRKFAPKGRRRDGKPFKKAEKSAGRPAWRERDSHPDGPAILYGWHTVTLALANPNRRIRKLILTENAARRLGEENIATRITPEIVRPQEIDRLLSPDAVHQGLLAEADPLPSPDIETLKQEGMVLVLDQITDPHNVGAILRSAAAFDALGIVTQDRHAPPESGTVARSASGALEIMPWVRVVNLARAMDEIAEAGFWRVGLTGEATDTLGKVIGDARIALVMGAEGEGMRHNTMQHCDQLARLPISPRIESLNVSNATAIALYAVAVRD